MAPFPNHLAPLCWFVCLPPKIEKQVVIRLTVDRLVFFLYVGLNLNHAAKACSFRHVQAFGQPVPQWMKKYESSGRTQPDPNEVPPTALTKKRPLDLLWLERWFSKEKTGNSQKCWAEMHFSSRRILEDWAFALHCSWIPVRYSFNPSTAGNLASWPKFEHDVERVRHPPNTLTKRRGRSDVWPVHFHCHRNAEKTNFMTPNLARNTFSERNLNQTLILNNIFQQSKSHATPQKTANSNHP